MLKLLPTLPNLRSLSLYWNLNVTDASLFLLAANCSSLVQLNLSGCKLVTDDGLRSVVSSCPNLTDLDLTRFVLSRPEGGEGGGGDTRCVLCQYKNNRNPRDQPHFFPLIYRFWGLIEDEDFDL